MLLIEKKCGTSALATIGLAGVKQNAPGHTLNVLQAEVWQGSGKFRFRLNDPPILNAEIPDGSLLPLC